MLTRFACVFVLALTAWADTTFVPVGSVWKYLDNGTDPGTAWRSPSFDDGTWRSGPAQLGYGDGDESTVVSGGADPNNRPLTTYFRRAFFVSNPAAFGKLLLRLLRDDGAVVYLNGIELHRSNMPTGAVTAQTPAASAVTGADESLFLSTTFSGASLLSGTNILAVEIHQVNVQSSDISFDLELTGAASVSSAIVTRDPYLQVSTPSTMVVRWRTDIPTDGRVRYGAAPGVFSFSADHTSLTTEHEIKLTGLLPETRYYYSIGTIASPLAGGDTTYFFTTSPSTGAIRPYRVWVLGDPGTGSSQAKAVRDAYLNFSGPSRTDLWILLGDNAYWAGLDSEYQSGIFDVYGALLRNSVAWPAVGNHDTDDNPNPPLTIPYFNLFSFPTNGEAGGVASGTKRYYSFDFGNIHFVVLDSMTSRRDAAGPMAAWLRNDLAATRQTWIVAYWHHPPSTKGTFDSDWATESVEMRQNIVPILEAANVDLVFTGHSHNYERSYLIDGHYGTAATFTAAMKKDGGNGRLDGTGAYRKAGLGGHEGTVYVVAGSGSQISPQIYGVHPTTFTMFNQLGSVVLDVNGNTLDVKFLRETGAVADYFSMQKGSVPAGPAAPTNLTANAVSSTEISLNWIDNAGNETGFRLERSANSGAFSLLATLSANTVAYRDLALTPATRYAYRLVAFNAAASSPYSNAATATTPGAPVISLIPSGAVWKYNDRGTDLGTAWRAPGFSDAAWPSGAAQLGYGDGDERSVVGYGPNANAKYITTYFRRGFTVANPAQLGQLTLRLLRDDGAAVYVNGVEVYRSNLPAGALTAATLATTAIAGADETTFLTVALNPALLTAGANVVAVEIHQASATSSDISFDLELTGQ
ncbi:MAG: metallophosphoesterase [Bryobacteraceae bacterium]|nr:metallophosphoesterase [Bryobacteraceae bacterium]